MTGTGIVRDAMEAMVQPGEVRVRRALLSVSDKTGVVEFARGLASLGVELLSTGGTATALREGGLEVRAVEDFTGFPEIMGGRVKTLHPKLYAGLLALRDNDEHMAAAAEHEVEFVDLVCVNLYPFEQTAARRGATEHEVIENIDIGGPTMIRAAAKNFAFTAVVVNPASYDAVLQELTDASGQAVARHARVAGRRGVLLHRPLRQRDLALVRGEAGRLPAAAAERLREGHRPRVRREPAPARRLLRPGRRAHARALDGAPARRQGAVVQQRAGSQRRAPARRRSSSCPPARSSSTTTRAGSPSAGRCSRPTARRSRAIRCRPSAASSASTARSTPRSPRRC